MRYSLKNRFKGCFIGAYLGLQLTKNQQMEDIFSSIFELSNLMNNQGELSSSLIFTHKTLIQGNNQQEKKENNKLALVLLPIILYFHENLSELEIIFKELETGENLKIWSEIISLICTEKVKPENLINEILTNHKAEENLLIKQLTIVEKCIKTGKSLQELINSLTKQKYLKQAELALAIYCFICTPEDFNLTLKRAKIISNCQDKIIVALTGVLSGVYNSKQYLVEIEDGQANQEIDRLAENLFMKWCGVYNMKQIQKNNLINVANINLIQRRKWSKKYEEF
jgi:hypothetical protein